MLRNERRQMLSTEHLKKIATQFAVFATIFKFSPPPTILSPPPLFFATELQPVRVLYSKTTQAVKLKSLLPCQHGMSPLPPPLQAPPGPTRPHLAPPGPTLPPPASPPPQPGSLAAWTASSTALPPASASSTSTSCQ